MLNEIKLIVINLLNQMRMADVIYGTYQNNGDVYVDIKWTIRSSTIKVPDHLKEKTTTCTGCTGNYTCTYKINEGLAAGDSVILLRQQGGQKYVIIGWVLMSSQRIFPCSLYAP